MDEIIDYRDEDALKKIDVEGVRRNLERGYSMEYLAKGYGVGVVSLRQLLEQGAQE